MAFIYIGKERTLASQNQPIYFILKLKNLDPDDIYVTNNGRIVPKETLVQKDETYNIIPRVLGGKGGFGSMLRALGAQIEKTTNREACRDLSGRRMRDVNQEQQLRDWVGQKAERERKRAEKRKQRADKRRHDLAGGSHQFVDDDYHQQKMKVLEQLDQALQQGLNQASTSSSSGASASATVASSSGATADQHKRKTDSSIRGPSAKKTCEWLGINPEDLGNLSNSDSESESTNEDSMSNTTSENPSVLESGDSKQNNGSSHSKSDDDKQSKEQSKEGKSSLFENSDESKSSQNGETKAKTVASKSETHKEQSPQDTKSEAPPKSGLLASLAELPPKTEEKKPQEEGPLDLDTFDSVADLEALGLDRLKSALMAIGLKCGGTLQERAARLWSIKGKPLDKIDPKLFARPAKGKKK